MTLSETIIAASNQNVYRSPMKVEDRDDRHSVEKALSESTRSHFGSSSTRHAMSFHDALAEILVSQKRGEVIAVGSNVGKRSLDLYVASNANKNVTNIKNHLEKVWNILKAIESENEKGGSPRSSSDATPQQIKGEELRILVYRYSMARFLWRYTKEKRLNLTRFFSEVKKDGSSYVKTGRPSDTTAYILKSEMELIDALKALHDKIEAFKQEKDANKRDDIRDKLSLFITVVNGEFTSHKLFSKEGVDPFLDRCQAIIQKLAKDNVEPKPDPNAFRRFYEKIFSLEHSIQELLRLTKSKNMSGILKLDCNITAVESHQLLLKYSLTEDSELKKVVERAGASWEDFKEKWKGGFARDAKRESNEHPHCECALLAHLVNNKINAYGYIGVSKLSCTGCSLYFKSYNEAAKTSNLPAFFTRGTHLKAYQPWVKPKLTDHSLERKVEEKLSKLATEILTVVLKQEFSGKGSDSSDMSVNSGDSETGAGLVKVNGGFKESVKNFVRGTFKNHLKPAKK